MLPCTRLLTCVKTRSRDCSGWDTVRECVTVGVTAGGTRYWIYTSLMPLGQLCVGGGRPDNTYCGTSEGAGGQCMLQCATFQWNPQKRVFFKWQSQLIANQFFVSCGCDAFNIVFRVLQAELSHHQIMSWVTWNLWLTNASFMEEKEMVFLKNMI